MIAPLWDCTPYRYGGPYGGLCTLQRWCPLRGLMHYAKVVTPMGAHAPCKGGNPCGGSCTMQIWWALWGLIFLAKAAFPMGFLPPMVIPPLMRWCVIQGDPLKVSHPLGSWPPLHVEWHAYLGDGLFLLNSYFFIKKGIYKIPFLVLIF